MMFIELVGDVLLEMPSGVEQHRTCGSNGTKAYGYMLLR